MKFKIGDLVVHHHKKDDTPFDTEYYVIGNVKDIWKGHKNKQVCLVNATDTKGIGMGDERFMFFASELRKITEGEILAIKL